MWEDPVVREVRTAGAKLLEACGGDLRKLAKQRRANQAKHSGRVVDKTQMLQTTEKKTREQINITQSRPL